MSSYETHRGVLKKVDTDNIRQYLFDLINDNKILNEDCNVTQMDNFISIHLFCKQIDLVI